MGLRRDRCIWSGLIIILLFCGEICFGAVEVQFGSYLKLDTIYDPRPAGNPDLFTPSSFPIGSSNPSSFSGSNFNFSIKASRVKVDVKDKSLDPNLSIHYENDFLGRDNTTNYRLYLLYAQYGNIEAGLSRSTLLDHLASEDTLDYEGPVGAVYTKQPAIRYKASWHEGTQQFAASLEKSTPETKIEHSTPVTRLPDFLAAYQLQHSGGHIRVAGLLRSIDVHEKVLGTLSTWGWAARGSGSFRLGAGDSFVYEATYGKGIGRYINDVGGLGFDAVLNSENRFEAIPILALVGAYQHLWSDLLRSNFIYSYVDAKNTGAQPTDYRQCQYVAVNLIRKLNPRIEGGLEYLYGYRKVGSEEVATAHRVQMSLKFDLSR